MNTHKIAMLLADGFEEAEAVIVADVLRRLDFDLELLGVEAPAVTGAHRIVLQADARFADRRAADFTAVILPGGMPGAAHLRDNPAVIDFVRSVHRAGGVAAAICAAPIALERAGLLAGRRFTAFPGFEAEFQSGAPTGRPAESDDRVVTGRGPGAAFAFAAAVAAALGKAPEVAAQLRKMLVES